MVHLPGIIYHISWLAGFLPLTVVLLAEDGAALTTCGWPAKKAHESYKNLISETVSAKAAAGDSCKLLESIASTLDLCIVVFIQRPRLLDSYYNICPKFMEDFMEKCCRKWICKHPFDPRKMMVSYSHRIRGIGIFPEIYLTNQVNAGEYTIHGWYVVFESVLKLPKLRAN